MHVGVLSFYGGGYNKNQKISVIFLSSWTIYPLNFNMLYSSNLRKPQSKICQYYGNANNNINILVFIFNYPKLYSIIEPHKLTQVELISATGHQGIKNSTRNFFGRFGT